MTTSPHATVAASRPFLTPSRVLLALGAVLLTLLATAGTAFAQDAEEAPTLEAVATTADTAIQSGNLVWIVIGAALVIFMQAGFAMVEVGFCRAKHAAHVVSTNLGIFFIGFVAFFLVGYPLMFGGYSYVLPGFDYGFTDAAGSALIGSGEWVFLWQGGWAGSWFDGAALLNTGATAAFFLYMVAFMDTTATIPTGSMAERWKFKSFVFWGLFCGALYYPLFGAWTWGGGWLSQLGNSLEWGNGYTDFAGSGIVHATGGVAALAGAIVLGPRLGKFTKDGKPRGLPGHNIPMAMLGTFILLFGWFGFNAASTFASSDPQIGLIAANTAIAGAFGGFTTMLWIWKRTGKPDPAMMANGLLGGLVIITAPCAFVDPWIAMVLGIVAGVIVVESVFFIERRLKVDDPVGAISVHGVCGTLGVLAVGLVANGKYGAGWNLTTTNVDAEGTALGVEGLFYGALTKGGIRSDVGEEEAGLDLPEMGVLAYPDFAGTHEGYSDGGAVTTRTPGT